MKKIELKKMYTETELEYLIKGASLDKPSATRRFLNELVERVRAERTDDVVNEITQFRKVIFNSYMSKFMPYSLQEEAKSEGLLTALEYAKNGHTFKDCVAAGCLAISRWYGTERKEISHDEYI